MNRVVILGLTIIVVFGLVFVGCTKSTPEPTPEPTPESTGYPTDEYSAGYVALPDGYNPWPGLALKPDGTPYHFALTSAILYAPFPSTAVEVLKTYIERAGGTCTLYDTELETAKHVAVLEDLIVSQPDAVTIFGLDAAALSPPVEKLEAAGIPVFNYDTLLETDNVTFKEGPDEYTRGHLLGEYAVEMVADTGEALNFYEIWCPMALPTVRARDEGFRDAVEGNPLITIMESPDCQGSEELKMNAILDAFPAHPELNAIFDQGGGPTGNFEALRQLDRLHPVGHPDHVTMLYLDADRDVLRGIDEGWIDVCVHHSPWEQADIVCKAMFTKVCCGLDIPSHVTLPTWPSITKENVNTPRWGAPARFGKMQYDDFDLWPVLEIPPTEIEGLVTPNKDMKLSGY